jgi:hypothetical protein
MNGHHFDYVAEHARSAVNRRVSLAVLGAALVTTVARAPGASAKKSGKNAKNSKKKCKRQVGQCIDNFAAFCAQSSTPDQCFAALSQCCQPLGACHAGAFLTCLQNVA